MGAGWAGGWAGWESRWQAGHAGVHGLGSRTAPMDAGLLPSGHAGLDAAPRLSFPASALPPVPPPAGAHQRQPPDGCSSLAGGAARQQVRRRPAAAALHAPHPYGPQGGGVAPLLPQLPCCRCCNPAAAAAAAATLLPLLPTLLALLLAAASLPCPALPVAMRACDSVPQPVVTGCALCHLSQPDTAPACDRAAVEVR